MMQLVVAATLGLRLGTPMMQIAESCTMGGGRVQGTLVRQSNGFVVPTAGEPSLPAQAPWPMSGNPDFPESCTMGGGRPQGTTIRQSNGFVVPAAGEPPLSKQEPVPMSR